MEDRIEKTFPKAHHRTEAQSQKNRSRGFKQNRTDEEVFRQGHDAAQIDVAHRLHEKLSLMQIHLLFGEICKKRHDRHKAKSTDLDQNQKDDLTEQAPMRISIVNEKSRHAGCAGCRKKSIERMCPNTLS